MATDRNGATLAKGDKVLVEMTIGDIYINTPAERELLLTRDEPGESPLRMPAAAVHVVKKDDYLASVGKPGAAATSKTAPHISITPSSGTVGTRTTISGSGFGASQGDSSVTFNSVPASPMSWTATRIVVSVPDDATSGDVVVTVNGQKSNAVSFSVTAL